jgi:hypothetical protein
MMKVTDLAQGVVFYNSFVTNPNVDDFGVLEIVKYEFKDGKRCLNPDCGGMFDRVPLKYENTVDLVITYKNSKGKTMKASYWLDSFENHNNLVLLDKNNAEHDFTQALILSEFKDAIRSLRNKLLDKGYSSTNVIDTMQLTSKFSENEHAKDLANKILNLYHDIITDCMF